MQAEPDLVAPGCSMPADFGVGSFRDPGFGVPTRRAPSARPRPTAATAAPAAPVLLRRTSGPARVPLLGIGTTGGDVRKLQTLLNLRLAPSPALRVDGRFGPLTAAAVRQLQHGASINVDGIAGKDTWRVLGTGKVYAGAQAGSPSAAAYVTAESARVAAPAPTQAFASSPVQPINDVLGWTAERKFLAVAQRAIDKMPGAARTELLNMVSPNAVGVTLALWATSHLVGAGVVIDLALFSAGVFMIGTAVIGVMEELGHCLVQTHNASNEQELDEAAGMLAHVIVVIGVTVVVALLAKIRLKGRGGSQAGTAAEAKTANTTSAARATPPRRAEPTRGPVVEQTSTAAHQKGLGSQNPLFKAAVQDFKNTDLSNAGRALTKHPELVGQTKETLRQTLRSESAINDAAHSALKNIMRNGTTTTPTLARYGTVTQIQIPGGFGARWASDGSFIGFINP